MRLSPLLLICASLLAQKPQTDWVMTFDDEFDGSELDLGRWSPHDPFGHARDGQIQAFAPEAVSVSGGQLHLKAQATTEAKPVRDDGKDREYVSGIVTTFGTFAQMYGRFEIRCKIPAGRGLQTAFTLYPVPLAPLPSIEVLTVSGRTPARIDVANHWGTPGTARSFGDSFAVPDLSAGFHTIAMEWDKDKIGWFVDGKETFRSSEGVPHQQMFLLLELSLGGAPDVPLPLSLDVDYVRAYQHR